MRLVFISSVTAMTPLRTISVITGSTLRRFEPFRFVVILVLTPRVGIARSRRLIRTRVLGAMPTPSLRVGKIGFDTSASGWLSTSAFAHPIKHASSTSRHVDDQMAAGVDFEPVADQ